MAQSADALYEEQAGYKKGYSNIDNIFVLQSLAQKYISKPKGRYYVLFVDFSKAFDKVSHKLFWYKILKYGLNGNILTVLKNMHTQFKSCASTPVCLTDYFSRGVETRQGCVLSPFLFVLCINRLMENMKNMGCQGIYIDENTPNIVMLYFADDIVDPKKRLLYKLRRLYIVIYV